MVDARVVSRKLEGIEQYHGELRDKQELSQTEFLSDITEQRAVERMFENVIQACVDLALHVATRAFGYEADSSKGAVAVLDENDVLDDETAADLIDAVGFRNVLAHEYGDVRSDQVYQYLQNDLELYEDVSQQVAAWFEGRSNTA